MSGGIDKSIVYSNVFSVIHEKELSHVITTSPGSGRSIEPSIVSKCEFT